MIFDGDFDSWSDAYFDCHRNDGLGIERSFNIPDKVICQIKRRIKMRYIFIMKAGSKLYLSKDGGYTPYLKEAQSWKTRNGAVRFFQKMLIHSNPSAILITIFD